MAIINTFGVLGITSITPATADGTVQFFGNGIRSNQIGSASSTSISFTSDVSLTTLNGGPISGTRNKIINGNFDIWQRGSSLANQFGGLVYLADRFAFESWPSTTARVTYDRVLDAPAVTSTVGFSSYSARITVTTTTNNSNQSDFGVFRQFIEGFNAQELYQRPFVVSFWVKSSLVGTYSLSIYGGGVGPGQTPGTPGFTQTYNINSPNTWEYKTIQVPACPAGTYSNWDFGNGRGMDIIWRLWTGNTSYSGSLGSWNSSGQYPFPAGSYTNFGGTNGATWQISQVQVEVGTTASSFERKLYGQELALCQRYFQTFPVSTIYGANRYPNVSLSSGTQVPTFFFPVEMRASPSPSPSTMAISVDTWSASGGTTRTLDFQSVSSKCFGFSYLSTSNSNVNLAAGYFGWSNTATQSFSAEL